MKRVRRHIPVVVLAVLLVGALVGPAGAAKKSFGQRFDTQVRQKLSKPGLVNDPGNPVHWTKLKGVPAVFADGADNGLTDINDCPADHAIRVIHADATVECVTTASGDITKVTAGEGLTGGGETGDVTISSDYTKDQKRVTGTCAAGQSIREVKQDGTVTCEADDNTGPIAAGRIFAAGNVASGTGNFTSTYNSTDGRYEITLTNITYSLDGYVTLITPIACDNVTFRTETTSGKIDVRFKAVASGNAATQCNFHFAVFDV